MTVEELDYVKNVVLWVGYNFVRTEGRNSQDEFADGNGAVRVESHHGWNTLFLRKDFYGGHDVICNAIPHF